MTIGIGCGCVALQALAMVLGTKIQCQKTFELPTILQEASETLRAIFVTAAFVAWLVTIIFLKPLLGSAATLCLTIACTGCFFPRLFSCFYHLHL
jgi:hypothetical protein